MTQRLPDPGSDDGTWGGILNGFLGVSLNDDGTLNTAAVNSALPSPIPPTNLGSGAASSSTYLRGDGTWATVSGSSAVSSVTVNGGSAQTGAVIVSAVQAAGDLGGTDSSPTVIATHLTAPLSLSQGGTGSASQNFVDLSTNQTLAGTKTFSNTIDGDISGNAATVTTNANLTGDVTSTGNVAIVGKVNGISVTGTPTPGQALVATSSSVAGWSTAAGPVGPAGPTGLNWRGSYSNSTTYALNDAVQYNGSSYVATAGTTGVNPGTPGSPTSPWTLLAEIGPTGPAGSGVAGLIAPSSQGFLGWSFDPWEATSSASVYTGQIYGTKITVPSVTITGVAVYVATAGATLTPNQNQIGLYDSNGNLQGSTPDCSGTTYTVTTSASSATITGTGFVSNMVGAQYTIAGVTGTFTVLTVASSTSLTMSATISTTVTSVVMTPTANYSWLSTGIKYINFQSTYVSSGGSYYGGILSVGTTVPKFGVTSSSLNSGLVNATSPLTGTFRSGQLGGVFSQTSLPASLTLASTVALNSTLWEALY